MLLEDEFMRMVHPYKKGGRIRRSIYESMKAFVLDAVASEPGLGVTALIGKAQEAYRDGYGEDTGWLIYQVKLDLEARGLIRTVRPKRRRRKLVNRLSKKKISR